MTEIDRSSQESLLDHYDDLNLLKLPEELKKNGFVYKLVKRENAKCIYSQSTPIIAYEVFKTKITNLEKSQQHFNKLNGTDIKASHEFKEIFPGDEDFGKRAWTYQSLEKALERYNSL